MSSTDNPKILQSLSVLLQLPFSKCWSPDQTSTDQFWPKVPKLRLQTLQIGPCLYHFLMALRENNKKISSFPIPLLLQAILQIHIPKFCSTSEAIFEAQVTIFQVSQQSTQKAKWKTSQKTGKCTLNSLEIYLHTSLATNWAFPIFQFPCVNYLPCTKCIQLEGMTSIVSFAS